MPENKTQPTDQPVSEFLAGIPDRRRADAKVLVELMSEISGVEAVMWGPSIIGFGSYTYRYASGHGGTFLKIGFSPRKANLSIYFMDGFDGRADELSRLGKHKHNVGCLYLNKLADIDLEVLREMLVDAWENIQDFDQTGKS